MPIRPSESADDRPERLLEPALTSEAAGLLRRRQVMGGRSGAVDLRGVTWR